MSDSPSSPAVAVICDRCRAEGIAADAAFAAIPDILAFDPVPRRAHVNNWTAEHQRAFIVALAMTGSARRAAKMLGRHAFGAEQLKSARGGRSFAEAWDAAMEIARDREFARIHANLSDLAARQAADNATAPGTHRLAIPFADDDDEDDDSERREYLDARQRIRMRLTRARRLLLAAICDDPARRAAWEVLVGPADWDAAERLEPQPDEPFDDAQNPGYDVNPYNFGNADMILTAEAGLIPDVTGGPDAMAEVCELLAAHDQAAGEIALTDDRTLSGERCHPDERKYHGGGYIDPAGGPLIPAHGDVPVPVDGVVEVPRPESQK